MLSQFLTSLMTNSVNIAVTPISHAFGLHVDDGQWLILAYLLALTSFLTLFGRLGDIYGHKRMFLTGFILFSISDLACAFAFDFWLLVGLRFAEGIGAALLQATSSAIIAESFPANQRGRALGINGTAVAVGWSIGPVIGGTLTTFLGWRYIFLLSTPLAVFGLIASWVVLYRSEHRRERVDFAGAVLSAIALFSLCLALSRAHVWGYASPVTFVALALALGTGVLFFTIEGRIAEPMLDLSLFRNRIFLFSTIASVLYFTSLNAVLFILPVELQTVVGMNGFAAGLAVMPLAATIALVSPFAGSLSDRVNARYLSSAGAAIVGLGALLLTTVGQRASVVEIALKVIVVGLGVGLFNQPNNNAIMGNAPRERLGTAAAILATCRATGGLLGAAIAGAIYYFRIAQAGAASTAPAATVYVCVACLCSVAVAVSYSRGRTGKPVAAQ